MRAAGHRKTRPLFELALSSNNERCHFNLGSCVVSPVDGIALDVLGCVLHGDPAVRVLHFEEPLEVSGYGLTETGYGGGAHGLHAPTLEPMP